MNPYEKCPVFENENYLLRLVEEEDAEELLGVYSDEKAVPYFNSDNCHGDNFHYTTLERMREAIAFWRQAYQQGEFVRWVIIDKTKSCAIGTIEMFYRHANDYFNQFVLLRLDLRSDYEEEQCIEEILRLILAPAFDMFGGRGIATKAPGFAGERRIGLEKLGFAQSEEKLIGGCDGKVYGDYYTLLY